METFTLVILLGLGRSGGPIQMSDYETEAECVAARTAAEDHWRQTHTPGYRVKFGAECILTVEANG